MKMYTKDRWIQVCDMYEVTKVELFRDETDQDAMQIKVIGVSTERRRQDSRGLGSE